ncbi:MAG: hypothetical protein JWP57_1516 [Spirosoma sp.]|nr:hypothetical protein [Spirosoma sp.]
MKRISTLTLWSALLGLLLFTASWTVVPTDGLAGLTASKSTSREPMFAGTRWQIVSYTLAQPIDYDGDGKPDSDLTQFLRPCDLDNSISFEPTGSMAFSSGKLHCNDTSLYSKKSGHWLFSEATKTFRIIEGGTQRISEWKVLEASNSVLKVAVRYPEYPQATVVFITWKRA